jgi:hypothetical protein
MLGMFLLAVIATRFYNLDHTARFTQDESTDLVRMQQYFEQRKITLVGPISTDNTKVFSSLTYYLQMPFAAATGFAPIGPVFGTAFWGVVTALLLLWIVWKKYPGFLIPAGLLIIVWYPLVEMSRWAWNPHFVVLWTAAGILAYEYRSKLAGWGELLSGLFFGLLLHHHYIAFFATAPFLGLIMLQKLQKKEFALSAKLAVGYALSILPFILFDLRHPPGLFLTKYLFGDTPHVEGALGLFELGEHLVRNYLVFLESAVLSPPLQVVMGLLFPVLLLLDCKSKIFRRVLWVAPAISILIIGIFLNEFQARYIYPAFGFLLIWLLQERKERLGQLVAQGMLYTLLLGSLLSTANSLMITKVQPDLYSFTQASQLIADTIREQDLKNANVAALAGLDPAPLAHTYRDVVRMHGASLREASEYSVSEHLFVISTNQEPLVRADESFAMQAFRGAKLQRSFALEHSDWKVYWYGYN